MKTDYKYREEKYPLRPTLLMLKVALKVNAGKIIGCFFSWFALMLIIMYCCEMALHIQRTVLFNVVYCVVIAAIITPISLYLENHHSELED